MISVSVLITNGHEFLLCQHLDKHNNQLIYSLPVVTTPTLIGAKRKIKKQIEELGVSFFIEKEIYNQPHNDDVHYVFLCHANKYVYMLKNDAYTWFDIKKCPDISIEDIYKQSSDTVCAYINNRLSIAQDIKKKINLLHDQSVVKLEFVEKLDGLQIYINSPDFRCAFSYLITFDFSSENELEYQINWVLNPSIAPGDKSDIYILFSESMAILLKLFFMEPVYINVFKHVLIDGKIGGAAITFESNDFNGVIDKNRIIDKAVASFELFNVTMGLHGMIIGSISHQNVNISDDDIISCLNQKCHNYVLREEHACYYDNKIACIYLNNGVYDPDELLKEYNYEVVDGVHGKLLLQHKCDRTFYNYIDNDEWKTVQKIIKERKFLNYKLLCQSNRLYIISGKEIWVITGWFHHGIADLEKEEILDRNQKERALLLANRDFSWKYPINYSRFEELCADLLEQLYPTSRVRLAGNANNADGGRDILIYTSDETLYICQCKAYQKSVGKSNVNDIRDTIEFHGATGFFLMVSSTVTAPLINHLESLRQKYKIDWWTEREIFKLLRRYPLLAESYKDILDIKEINDVN